MAELRINTVLDTAGAMAQAEQMRRKVEAPAAVHVDLSGITAGLERIHQQLQPSMFSGAFAALRSLGAARIEVAGIDRMVAGMREVGSNGVEAVDAFGAAARSRLVGPITQAIEGVRQLKERFAALPAPVAALAVGALGIGSAVTAAMGAAKALSAAFSACMVPVRWLGNAIAGIWRGITGVAGKVVGGIRSAIGGLVSAASSVLETITSVLSPGVAFAGGGIVGFAIARMLGKLQADTGPLAGVKAQIGAGEDSGTGLLQQVMEKVSGELLALVKAVQSLFPVDMSMADMLAKYVAPALDWIRTHLVTWTDTLLAVVQQGLRVVDGVVGAVLAVIAGDWSAVMGSLANAAAQIVVGIRAILQAVAPALDAVVDWVARAMGQLLQQVAAFFSHIEPYIRAIGGGASKTASIAAGAATLGGAALLQAPVVSGIVEALGLRDIVGRATATAATGSMSLWGRGDQIAAGTDEWSKGLDSFAQDMHAAGVSGVQASAKIDSALAGVEKFLTDFAATSGAGAFAGSTQGIIDAIDQVRATLGTGVAPDPAAAANAAVKATERKAEATVGIQTALGQAKVAGSDQQILVAKQGVSLAAQQLGVLKQIHAAGGVLS